MKTAKNAIKEAITLTELLAEKIQEANLLANAEDSELLSLNLINEIRPLKELESRLALINI